MQSKITLQLTFNFGDQLNNDLIPKIVIEEIIDETMCSTDVSIHAHLIERLDLTYNVLF